VSRAPWVLTARDGPRVTRERHRTLDGALSALEGRADELTGASTREEIQFLGRRIEPSRQVVARLEIAGPGGWRGPRVAGGVDIRGDGTAEAFTGRLRRIVLDAGPGESAVAVLRRALSE
jgi:hypothetical protein